MTASAHIAASDPDRSSATIGLTGDVMCHLGFVIQEHEGRSFGETFAPAVRDLCRAQDEMWGNLEGPVSDTDDGLLAYRRARRSCYSWPKLFFPYRYISTLTELNFKVLGIANNHSFDFETASDTTVSHSLLSAHGVDAPGICFEPVVREVGGLSFAVFATTSLVNPPGGRRVALLTPASLPCLLNGIRRWSRRVDFVTVMTHWGEDYESQPPREVTRLTRQLWSAGANVVYGNHPHILWPVEQPAPDKLVCYSLGNFTNAFGCSTHAHDSYPFTKSSYGGILSVMFRPGRIRAQLYPLVTRHNYDAWRQELGLRSPYWRWSPRDIAYWKSTLARRRRRLFFRVERNGSPVDAPLTSEDIERFYPWSRWRRGASVTTGAERCATSPDDFQSSSCSTS